MDNIIYIIDYHDGTKEKKTLKELHKCIDDIIDDIQRLRKQFRWNKTVFLMTLYTSEESFEANEYISHYNNLSAQTYGPDFLTNDDIELINKLNF
jgi:hypothetical protein